MTHHGSTHQWCSALLINCIYISSSVQQRLKRTKKQLGHQLRIWMPQTKGFTSKHKFLYGRVTSKIHCLDTLFSTRSSFAQYLKHIAKLKYGGSLRVESDRKFLFWSQLTEINSVIPNSDVSSSSCNKQNTKAWLRFHCIWTWELPFCFVVYPPGLSHPFLQSSSVHTHRKGPTSIATNFIEHMNM